MRRATYAAISLSAADSSSSVGLSLVSVANDVRRELPDPPTEDDMDRREWPVR